MWIFASQGIDVTLFCVIILAKNRQDSAAPQTNLCSDYPHTFNNSLKMLFENNCHYLIVENVKRERNVWFYQIDRR